MTDKHQAALDYAAAGYAVFPVAENAKKPLTAHGVKDATRDRDQINAWWSKHPNANIGLACGSASGNLLVVDLDNKSGKSGSKALRDWSMIYGKLPDTYTVATPSGGRHLYYISRSGRNAVDLLPGVDCRYAGGYVLVPPSTINGVPYKAENSNHIAAGGEVLEKLLSYQNGGRTEKFELPEDIPEGSRNNIIFKLAASLRDKGLTREAILAACEAENAGKCSPPLSDQELITIVDSAMKYTPKHSYENMTIKKGLIPLESVQDLKINWLWEPYIQRGNLTILRGDGGVGKTYFVSALMSALAQAKTPKGMPGELHTHNGRSVYFGNEDDPSTIKARVKAAGGGSGIFVYADPISFQDAEGLRAVIEEASADLVIFDPIQAYLGRKVDMNAANEVRPLLETLRTIARETDCAILIIEHQNKNAKQDPLYRGIGTVDITSAARSVLIAVNDPSEEDQRVTFQIKTNARRAYAVRWKIDSNGRFEWDGIESRSLDELFKIRRAREKGSIQPGVKYATYIMNRNPNGWKGTAAELIEACPELNDDFTTPKILGRSLMDEDIQFLLKHDCFIAVRVTNANNRRVYHMSRIDQSRSY